MRPNRASAGGTVAGPVHVAARRGGLPSPPRKSEDPRHRKLAAGVHARTLSRLAAMLCVVAATLVSTSATAAPLDLVWSAPAACPRRERVADDVSRMAHPAADARRVRAEATVVERGSIDRAGRATTLFVVDLVVDGGSRHLEADDCESLANAVALILALAIDPNAKPLAAPAPPAQPGEGSPAPAAVPSAPPAGTAAGAATAAPARELPRAGAAPPAPTSPERSWTERLTAFGVGVAADGATLPNAAAGPGLFAGVRIAPVHIDLFGALFPEQTASVQGGATTAGARIAGAMAGVRGGPSFRAGPIELGPQVALTVRSLSASAFGATTSSTGSAEWLALGAGGHAALVLHSAFAVRADVTADFALATPEFVIENLASVHRPAATTAAGFLGFKVRLR